MPLMITEMHNLHDLLKASSVAIECDILRGDNQRLSTNQAVNDTLYILVNVLRRIEKIEATLQTRNSKDAKE